MSENKLQDLAQRADFPWRLRVLMALADICAGELSAESGVSMQTIYRARANQLMPSDGVRYKLLESIERWKPGALDMMRAAEKVPCKQ